MTNKRSVEQMAMYNYAARLKEQQIKLDEWISGKVEEYKIQQLERLKRKQVQNI